MNRRHFLKSAAIASGLIYAPRGFADPMSEAALLVKPPVASGGGVTGTPLFSGITVAGPVNNFGGDIGGLFACTASFTSAYVQRWVIAGNTGTHLVKIKNTSGTVLASATVSTSGVTAETYASAALAFSFVNGTSYYIECAETNGGDFNYQGSGGVGMLATIDASFGSSLVASANASVVGGGTGRIYVPVNILH